MDQKEVKEIFKSLLTYEFGSDSITDLRVHFSNGVASFQGTVIVEEGDDNEF